MRTHGFVQVKDVVKDDGVTVTALVVGDDEVATWKQLPFEVFYSEHDKARLNPRRILKICPYVLDQMVREAFHAGRKDNALRVKEMLRCVIDGKPIVGD